MEKYVWLLSGSNPAQPMSYTKNILFIIPIIMVLVFSNTIAAQPNIPESPFIKVDQFGYLPTAQKVAVISDPQQGYNQDAAFQSGSRYEVRVWETDQVVFGGSIQAWQNGEVDSQSGDRGWWFDFSSVRTSGNYYLFDTENQVRSIQFSIDPAVYSHVLKAAARMFFYNRSNITKTAPYAQKGWRDAISFEQDIQTYSVLDKQNTALTKDLRGGWFDAGDLNKYVTYAEQPLHDLLWAFQENPEVFTDNWNIPESGNSIPDLLDEIKWELDWLVKMNNVDGSTHIKMGSQNFSDNNTAPPSTNKATRYYGPTCTSASITVAGVFAHAAKVFSTIPTLNSYAKNLEHRAITSWNYVLPFLTNNQLETNCDKGEIISGDADISVAIQKDRALTAAIYLFDLTGNTQYQQYILHAINETEQISSFYWAPYKMGLNDALLHYTTLGQADAATRNLIISSISSSAASNPSNYFDLNDSDLYRSFLPSGEYGWGSNKPKAGIGVLNQLLVRYKINEGKADNYRQRANEQLHYFHGVNPLGMVYLTNMYSLGAERSANEIFHRWFRDGSIWDNALTSKYGPPPGYIVGGPNVYSSVSKQPPANQPPQKSYLDFNDDNLTNPSWEISEPSITYQGIYVRLIAHFAKATANCPPEGMACDDGDAATTNDQEDGFCACVGTRVESSCNLIINGSFASTIDTWKYWECTPVFNAGEIRVTNIISGSDPWDAAIRQEDLSLEQGRKYTITFDARATANRPIVVKVGLSIPPFTAYLWQPTNISTQTQSYSFPFTMKESNTDFGALEFFMGGNATDLFIDNITLKPTDCQADCLPAGTLCNDNNPDTINDKTDGNCNCSGTIVCPPVGTTCNDNNPNTINDIMDGACNCNGTNTCPPPGTSCDDNTPQTINDTEDGNCNCIGIGPCELIENGDFSETSLEAWESWSCTPVIENGQLQIGDIAAVPNPWDAAIRQTGRYIVNGKNYQITFDGYAASNREMTVKSGLSNSPFTAYHFENVQLTPQRQSYTISFRMNEATTANGALEFFVGGNTSAVILDNIHFGIVNCMGNNCPAAGSPCNDNKPNTTNDMEDGNCNCAGTLEESDQSVVFKFGQINGSVDETVAIPVTISNFINTSSFQLVDESEYPPKKYLQVYPNPFSIYTHFNFYLEQKEEVSLSIFDAMGKTVYHTTKYLEGGLQKWSVSSESLTAGVYIYKLETPKFQEQGQLLVIK